MNILFLTEYFPPEPNAAATRVHERARHWTVDDHRVTVVTCAPNFPQGRVYPGYRNRWWHEDQMGDIHVVRVKTFVQPNRGTFRRALDQLSFFPLALLAALRADRPDVIVATSPTLFAALAASVAGLIRSIPFVLEIGDLASASIGAVGAVRTGGMLRIVQRLEGFAYRRAERIVVQTESMRREVIAAGVPSERISIISNGVDLAKFKAVSGDYDERVSARPFVVGYVGTLGMSQGLETVLDAAIRLRAEPDVMFRMIGDGAARAELEQRAAERGITNVQFEGPYPRERMPDILASMSLALVSLRSHPTFRTVVPSKIFEAMACGIPVLLSAPEGEASTLVRHYAFGTVVSPEDPPELAQAVRRLLASPDLLRTQSANARAAAGRYDRRQQAAQYLAVLEDVVMQQRAPT